MTRILILDDEPDIARCLSQLIELAGYECSWTTDSYEALALLRREPIDLFIQDCLRPDIHGLEMYQRLKADPNLRLVPVLFFSAGVGPLETAKLRSPYGDAHLRKPASLREILAVVMAMLRRSGCHIPTAAERLARYREMKEKWGIEWERSVEELETPFRSIDAYLSWIMNRNSGHPS